MGIGAGFGKIILFSDHFVVNGVPGIVSALDSVICAEVKKGNHGIAVENAEREQSSCAEERMNQRIDAVKRILKVLGINPERAALNVTLGGNLPEFKGIGASAACTVAIARAISEEFGLNVSDEKVNEAAFEAEKAFAGTPSGIDNTAATYGGLLWFKKNNSGEANLVEKLTLQSPVEVIVASTGVAASTKSMVEGVAKRRKENPIRYNELFKRAEEVAFLARNALERFDLPELGRLMNEDHALLQQIGVSVKELDILVDVSRKQGAFGAKLTGVGGGGCMIALTPGKELQEKVASAIKSAGFQVLKARIGN